MSSARQRLRRGGLEPCRLSNSRERLIALECGYADQSHLIRDFHTLAGLSPTAWLAEERANIAAGGHRTGEALN